MSLQRVVVFGGTGFLGRRAVSALATKGMSVGVASRRPFVPRHAEGTTARITPVVADVTDAPSVTRAVDGAEAVVNCVGLYVESRDATFQAVHVSGARNIASAATRAGAAVLVHISGIGSDRESGSPYVRARGEGEAATQDAFPEATILRPSVMFAPGDAFLSTIARIAALTPVIPLFGIGDTRLQPVFADDVAGAVARTLTAPMTRGGVYELGGPDIMTYRTVVENVLRWTGRRRLLLPFPFIGWQVLANAAQILPSPPLTEGQVALMRRDNIVSRDARTFADLGLTPRAMADIAPSYLAPP